MTCKNVMFVRWWMLIAVNEVWKVMDGIGEKNGTDMSKMFDRGIWRAKHEMECIV